ncbi:macro domain-containing protein [Dysgonomonas sp. ZJ279]|uniref:macro domain-containing protein n=1 Tax=Dysgonomonas sp. ZJ279 TaxID=2709796 RepID=UPI002107B68F|nr:macro domain-containing protein [Dysgonomonas sp. ZJ279]
MQQTRHYCYRKSLEIADSLGIKSIAFPNISTGVYRFPKYMAAQIAVNTVRQVINNEDMNIEEVIFVCFDDDNYNLYNDILNA